MAESQRRPHLPGLAAVWALETGLAQGLLQERPTVTSAAGQLQIGHVALELSGHAAGDPGGGRLFESSF